MYIDKKVQNYEVVIIGAGPAGIGAALMLQKQNLPFVILEARDRIGGRVSTKIIDGTPVDLGACWIHSYGKQNPLKPHVNSLKIKEAILDKRKIGRVFIDGQEGKQFDQTCLDVACQNNSCFFRTAQMNAAKSQTDLSLYDAAKDFFECCLVKFTPKQKRCTQLMINMTEHYEGSSTHQLSTCNYQFRVDSGGDYMPECGYGEVLKKIVQAQKLNIIYQKIVTTICYQKEGALVQCKDGSVFTAKKIISSLPLGVLKSGKILFKPQLPKQYQESIKKLGMGLMNKVIAAFQQNFWGQVGWISIGCNERGKFSQIYNLSQKGKHILCCFITDDFAKKCEKLDPEAVVKDFLSLLCNIYGSDKVKMKEYIITAWGSDQFSMGSYSSFHVGSSPQDCYQLRTPINDTLWMIGEHCYAQHIGTAHGAFKTGACASQQILKSLKWINPILKQPKHIKKKQ